MLPWFYSVCELIFVGNGTGLNTRRQAPSCTDAPGRPPVVSAAGHDEFNRGDRERLFEIFSQRLCR